NGGPKRSQSESSVMKTMGASILLACCVSVLMQPAFSAQTYPTRPIRLIVPFPPGGGTDIMGRLVAAHLTEKLGVQTVVDNRGGAGGIIGTELAVKANPDGQTLLIGSVSTISINPSLYRKLPFDTLKDLAPVSLIASTPSVLVVTANLAAKTVKDLIALAKAKPGQINFASAGSGTSHHLGGELFKAMAGISIVHVPYKGTAPAVTDLVSGQVAMMIANMPAVLPMVKAGRLRALAVTSLTRSTLMPELPTVAESAVPDFEVIVWYGVLAPAATPKPVVAKLNEYLQQMANLQEVKDRLASQGAEAISSTPDAFSRKIRDDMKKWAKVVQTSGAQPD
ncbi:MAG TPA: tripartite tricarboxylate transporter substrate binding protein, partial [Burkholderiales bacterium]|nr:tripartite tricarboxylate transporter substrate binding protein [Burkholderiales bacterium]